MKGDLAAGDMIFIKGKETNFSQKVDSLQIESVNVQKAKKGQLVGLKTKKKCRYCGRMITTASRSKSKTLVCDGCATKDNRCIAVDYKLQRCRKRKVPGQPYCIDHLPRKDSV